MAYAIQLAQINVASFGLTTANTSWGFPANTDFHTMLMSFWMCGPTNEFGTAGIWPTFTPAAFFDFNQGIITLTNKTLGTFGSFFTGNFNQVAPGVLANMMMSVDTHAQTVQVYINDQNVPVTSGVWTGSPPYNFDVNDTINIWGFDVSGVTASGLHPALADAWISNTPSFVDLSIAANRRKFVNANLTPVDLGAIGDIPFGYQPALYMSVRPSGVATDILNNLGVGGGSWTASGGMDPTFQAPGSCVSPSPPRPFVMRPSR